MSFYTMAQIKALSIRPYGQPYLRRLMVVESDLQARVDFVLHRNLPLEVLWLKLPGVVLITTVSKKMTKHRIVISTLLTME